MAKKQNYKHLKLNKLAMYPYFIGFLMALAIGGIFAFFVTNFTIKTVFTENLHQKKEVLLLQIYKVVALCFFVITFLFFFISYILLKKNSKKIAHSFQQTIFQLKSYNVKISKQLKFLPTDVFELKQLHNAIEDMATRTEKDYRLLKEYTENVSHEIQTPLAIIKNKIELLLQDQTLGREHLLTLAKLHQSTGRLSKLSKNLAVLTKIENNQFVKNSEFLLADFITERLEDFEELIALKQLQLETNFEGNPKLSMNTTLAYLLFNNLISNAVRHNINKGKINISITDDKFVISNTGNPLKTSNVNLFNRFAKFTDNSESTGLGLAMVKKIVSFYGFYISYKNDKNIHKINIFFIKKIMGGVEIDFFQNI